MPQYDEDLIDDYIDQMKSGQSIVLDALFKSQRGKDETSLPTLLEESTTEAENQRAAHPGDLSRLQKLD